MKEAAAQQDELRAEALAASGGLGEVRLSLYNILSSREQCPPACCGIGSQAQTLQGPVRASSLEGWDLLRS